MADELSPEEKVAEEAAKVAEGGDWGPIFVYGSMLSEQAWGALIERVPEMRSALLRGFVRRRLHCAGFAATIEQPDGLLVGKVVVGLSPRERRLLDAVVDDGFALVDAKVRYLDEMDEDLECTMYAWREEFADACVEGADWCFEDFCEEHLADFTALCADMRESHRAEHLPDDDLKELALARRRRG
uniref:Putative gamma-glutamylcyclotransferase n=1 Tax=Alexandrium monilatum TaxID=311494 RepID=A0A7S4PVU3_9DINO|mmetsp:Transcript_10184/g.30587  ORF Transcript_10184/g.30587 Transcript_10184/m.30587 type:complete len:186 (-) Transcript_10184:81-638(-)